MAAEKGDIYGEYYNPDIYRRLQVVEEIIRDYPEFKKSAEQMLYWWRGNGSPGAREIMTRFVTEEHIEKIIDYTIKKVMEEEAAKQKHGHFRWMEVIIAGGVLLLTALELFARM